jgi:chromosomal replication initiator protein
MQTFLWQNILGSISTSLDSHSFDTFFKPLSLNYSSDNSVLYLNAPNTFISEYVTSHFKDLILSTSSRFGYSFKNVVITSFSPPSPSPLGNGKSVSISEASTTNLNKRFTLNSFVVGPNNEFAKSAALAVSNSPGKTKFNPLLIYGGVGLGKTHLLQSIGNFVLHNYPSLLVTYITSEEFYLNFIDAIKNNKTKIFTSRFRSSDLLLMDDVQFFSGKESTQEEFFYIFNTLYQEGKQIVLTSDLPPSSIKGIQDRLISRFQWGLCVDIQPPDLETRVAILKKKAEDDNLSISQDILYFIAENVSSNIRELEGLIIRLLAFASITKSDISLDLVKNMLNESKPDISKISIDKIIEKVSEFYNVPVNNIREKNRIKEVALCRQIAMYISKKITNNSLKTIGLNFGGRDHSTVIHAVKTIEKLKKSDFSLQKDINTIMSNL